MNYQITKVVNPDDLKRFIKFPYELYKHCENWVPPLIKSEYNFISDSNPNFSHSVCQLWIVIDENNKVVGRVLGIVNKEKYVDKNQMPIARFGLIEFIDEYAVSRLIFKTLCKWSIEQSCSQIQGPLGFTDLDKQGLLISGFSELCSITGSYNFEYYLEHFQSYGFKNLANWIELRLNLEKGLPNRIKKWSQLIKQKYSVKEVALKSNKEIIYHIDEIFELINSEYKENFGYCELNPEEIKYYKDIFLDLIDSRFVSILKLENKIVGFGLALPSLSKAFRKANGRLFPFGILFIISALKRNAYSDGYLIAVKSEYRKKGLHCIMINRVFQNLIKCGVKYFDTGIELVENENVQRIWKDFNYSTLRTRRAFNYEFFKQ